MDSLYQLLKEYTEIYKMFLELEYDKYEAVIEDDVIALDNIVSQEEVYYLQMKGIEHKRENLLNSLELSGKTLKEIIDAAENESKIKLQEQFEELNNKIKELNKINDLLKIVIEVRLRRINNKMNNLGEKENIYTNDKSKNVTEGLLISHKI
ncbi:MAG: flagellar export chaperone FlgN [Sedimentibacter sp.]|nr:flagellar export chaperone FlgN [Sedimentibacter sp.]